MKDKLTHIIQRPFFLFLLPLFFLLHTLLENFNPILVKDAFILFFIYSGVALLITALFWFLYRNLTKAALATCCIMAVNFFFGTIYDSLKKHFDHSFFIKFSFILPVILVLLILLVIYLKKSRRTFLQTAKYLNILLLLLILIDTGTLFFKLTNSKGPAVSDLSGEFRHCDSCAKPDIYLLIADEYAGKTELQDLFSFDNSPFENELQNRGFHMINNSASNYNQTVYSMASLFNMDYISHLNDPALMNYPDMLLCRMLIKDNTLVSYLKKINYNIYNYSFFDLADQKRAVQNVFPTNRTVLTYQTLVKRLIYAFGARLASKEKLLAVKQTELHDNEKIDLLTREVPFNKDLQPKFIYSHFNMPHWPYFFDSTGTEVPVDKLTDEFTMDKKAYIEYLQYTNKKLLDLVDHIKKNAARPPVIILMGDHGFRQLTGNVDKKYHFMNLNAVLLPGGDYSKFYDGMSNANQFRVILNTQFGQTLPLLKDSVNFIWDH